MVADEKCHIVANYPKFGGASHETFVWENSQLNTYMQTLHRNGESVWLLGDSGYALRPWLMTHYNNPAPGSAAETFNKLHSRARVTIENTFGRLKNRWRCVCKDRVLHYKPEKCAQIILACSLLHNIALDFGVPDPQGQRIDELMPKNKLKKEKLEKHEFTYKSKAPVSAIQWLDTQLVNVLTIAHNPKSVCTVERTQKDGSKKDITIPTAIAEYTVNMYGRCISF